MCAEHRLRRMIRSGQILAALLLCTTGSSTTGPSASDSDSGLTSHDIAVATAVARTVVDEQRATLSSASAIAVDGHVEQSNTGHSCTPGRLLRIKLIGSFPRGVTTGHPVLPGEADPDFTVAAMLITVEAAGGEPCLIGVQTREEGEPRPLPGGTLLRLR